MNTVWSLMAGRRCRQSSTTGSPDPLPSSGGRNAGREGVDAEDTRSTSVTVRARTEPAGDRGQSGSEHRGREQLSGPRPDGGSELAFGGRVQRRGTRDIIISAATGTRGGTAASSRLGGGPS